MRAVDRIDDPQALGVAGERRGRFFAQKMIAGKGARDLPANECLHLAVGDADEILRALELDRQRRATQPEIARTRAGLAREAPQECVALIDRHPGQLRGMA